MGPSTGHSPCEWKKIEHPTTDEYKCKPDKYMYIALGLQEDCILYFFMFFWSLRISYLLRLFTTSFPSFQQPPHHVSHLSTYHIMLSICFNVNLFYRLIQNAWLSQSHKLTANSIIFVMFTTYEFNLIHQINIVNAFALIRSLQRNKFSQV